MHQPSTAVTDELVEVRHRIYHRPEFVANIDNLLCLQDMDDAPAQPAPRPTAWPASPPSRR